MDSDITQYQFCSVTLDYRLAAKTGTLFGIVSGVFGEPLQAIGFLGLNDLIYGSHFLPQMVSSIASDSMNLVFTTLEYALAGVIAGVLYVIVFEKLKNKIPTNRTQTKALIFYLIASVFLDWIPNLIMTISDLVKVPNYIGTYLESFSVSIVLTLFWGTLFAYVVTRMDNKIATASSPRSNPSPVSTA